MLMAGQTIAKNYASNLLGVDEADAAQQVSIFLLESIRKYDPDYRTPKGRRVKLCTFAYNRSESLLKEWVLTAEWTGRPDDWMALFAEAGYEGDYDWTIVEAMGEKR